ncbi:MAG: hypothetical protein ABIR70_16390 [Bryobacteraceae bacterium]
MDSSTYVFDSSGLLSWTSDGLYVSYFGLGVVAILAVVVVFSIVSHVVKAEAAYSKLHKLH